MWPGVEYTCTVHRVCKAFAYITWTNRLLVFTHVGIPEAGVQVPAGTIRPGEAPSDAVVREAVEETGWKHYRKVEALGCALFDCRLFGKAELHERHFFHLQAEGTPPLRFRHYETDPEGAPGSRLLFELFWVEPAAAKSMLIAEHGALLEALDGRFA